MSPDLIRVLRELRDITNGFNITGEGVSGNLIEGYNISPEIGGGSGGSIIPVNPTGACCLGTTCSITTEGACEDSGGVYQGDHTPCDPNPCTCCDVSSIRLQLHIAGTIDPGSPACATFDCTYDKTWTSPGDFNDNPCSGNQTMNENDIDNSDCITCTSDICGHVPWGVTNMALTLFPFSGPPTIFANIDLGYHCGDFEGHNCCGHNNGDVGIQILPEWITGTCPIGVYNDSDGIITPGFEANWEIIITIS